MEQIYTSQSAERIVELQNRERMVSFERLEAAIQDLQPMIENKRTRIQGIRLLKEIEERRAKLLGLDMPSKHASTDPTGQHEYGKIPDEYKLQALARGTMRRVAEEAENIVDAGVAELEAELNYSELR